jgi:hypothetical protein
MNPAARGFLLGDSLSIATAGLEGQQQEQAVVPKPKLRAVAGSLGSTMGGGGGGSIPWTHSVQQDNLARDYSVWGVDDSEEFEEVPYTAPAPVEIRTVVRTERVPEYFQVNVPVPIMLSGPEVSKTPWWIAGLAAFGAVWLGKHLHDRMRSMAKGAKLRRKRRRRNPDSASAGPSRFSELAYTVGAGLGGYAATRLTARIAHSQALKRWPQYAKHVTAVGALAGASGAYFASKYWDQIAEHHDSITLGAGIGAAQTLVQAYLPQYAWVVSDIVPSAPKAKALTAEESASLDQLLGSGELELGPLDDEPRTSTALLPSTRKSDPIEDLAGDLAGEWKF